MAEKENTNKESRYGMWTDLRTPIRNPNREQGKLTEEEMEVPRIVKEKVKQKREIFTTKTYQYWAPFHYPNIVVELGRPDIGGEYNIDGVELDNPPYGAITISEEEPILNVAVTGSACVPPGYIMLYAEPVVWKYPRTGVKMKVENLWGEHVWGGHWQAGVDEGSFHAGMSSAHFDVPESKKLTIMAGSQMDLERSHLMKPDSPFTSHHDAHYCIRIIRVTVRMTG